MYLNHFSAWILVAPRFSAELEPQNVTPNSDVSFRVVFEGTPPFTVKWFKDNAELVAGASCAISLKKNSSSLELIAVHALQSGVYSCQVTNEAGMVKTAAEMLVKGRTLVLFVHHHHHRSLSRPSFSSVSLFIFISLLFFFP